MVADCYLPPWFSIAPMMDWTDHHYRTLARLLSKHAWLYTEMLAAETIVYQNGNLDRFLAYSPDQHPIVLQIGGSNLENLAKATELATAYCYDEINFNCGCPSQRVAGRGCFGARLMLDPKGSNGDSNSKGLKTVQENQRCELPRLPRFTLEQFQRFRHNFGYLTPNLTNHDLLESLSRVLDFIFRVQDQTPTANSSKLCLKSLPCSQNFQAIISKLTQSSLHNF